MTNKTNAQYIAREIVRAEHAGKDGVLMHLRQWVHGNGPSGSGIDSGTVLSDSSTKDRIVLLTSFHHMDRYGGYTSWSDHTIVVTPSLAFDFNVRVTGRDRDGIKEYLSEIYQDWLKAEKA